jgi:hypothetical protein
VIGKNVGQVARKDNWKEFTSDVGGFSVHFPGKPKLESDEKGKRSYLFTADEGRVVYSITYFDLPLSSEHAKRPGFQDETLNELARVLAKKNVGNKEAEVQPIQLGDNPGREIRGELPDGLVIWARDYLVSNRLYVIKVGGEKGAFNETNAETFLNSFRLNQ